jgi:hypothetical protein
LTFAACTTDVDLGNGVRQRGDHVLFADGPELRATLGTHQVSRSVGDEWLVLAAQLRPGLKTGTVTVSRGSVSVRSPDGRRLPLIGQEEYRKIYGKVRVRVERALASLPVVGVYERGQMPCDRWFLTGPFEGFAFDEISVNTFQVCSGPLVFHVPGGVQPGRWRLIIDLEESTADIPFEIAVSD